MHDGSSSVDLRHGFSQREQPNLDRASFLESSLSSKDDALPVTTMKKRMNNLKSVNIWAQT
jgi:hypothetical protein